MDWRNPETLYLILPLCIFWMVLAIYSDRRRRRARESFAAQEMRDRVLPSISPTRFWLKQLLRLVAIVSGLVGLAGPRWGTEFEEVVPRGSDLYVMIDVSKSMLAQDVPPSRLGRAKLDVSALVNRLQGERVGLIAFAGQAVVKCPLTVDYDSFRRALDELDTTSAPRGGTAIGDAIRKAMEVFSANTQRDQAVLLITDGDDQSSYPMEAAATASERKVTVFTVGLGDADQGARIPAGSNTPGFVEYKGEPVWSKLGGSLLSEIALKTGGIYIPAGTRAYDLGELYATHLQNRQSDSAEAQRQARLSEQFQIFLALALLALLVDLLVSPYGRTEAGPMFVGSSEIQSARKAAAVIISFFSATLGLAEQPHTDVRDGLRLYQQEKFDAAQAKFSSAQAGFSKSDQSEAAAVAAFDQACAYQRMGEHEKARENYLKAGLSKDRTIGASAHFNLGTMAAERARGIAGEKPEVLEIEKRKEVLEHLAQAISAFRHCLEIQPEHPAARRSLELVRMWIKYYTDKWREQDRQKKRTDSNLLQFLEFIMQTQTELKSSVKGMVENSSSNPSADTFADWKRLQDELKEEIPHLKDKIESDLRPRAAPNSNAGALPTNPTDTKELDEGIRMLKSLADSSSDRMDDSSKNIAQKAAIDATKDMQRAVDELDKIWDAIIPFQPLLAKNLADETAITETLTPKAENSLPEQPTETQPTEPQPTELPEIELAELIPLQERTLRKTQLMILKAEMELQQLADTQSTEQPQNQKPKDAGDDSKPTGQVDPEQAKAGFQKAIELAPQAVEQMKTAIVSMKNNDHQEAAKAAELARKILQEIQDAQPKPPNQDKNQDKNQEQNQDQKSTEENKEENKKNEEKKNNPNQQKENEQQKQQQQQQQQQASKDRTEDAFRKVRERQQEKRDRDRQNHIQILGRAPVEKDW